jgi:hypothetical protein
MLVFTSILLWASFTLGHPYGPGARDVTPEQWKALNSSIGSSGQGNGFHKMTSNVKN